MYDTINRNAPAVVAFIQAARGHHVQTYDWLVANRGQVRNPNYRQMYKRFWMLTHAGADFLAVYFWLLEQHLQFPRPLIHIVDALHRVNFNARLGRRINFSFATKLFHMGHLNTPIYDSRISTFYSYSRPENHLPLLGRIFRYDAFHLFLQHEYRRVLQNGLLAPSIHAFRQALNPQQFTDEKIIDSLIWAYVSLLDDNGLMRRQVVYH